MPFTPVENPVWKHKLAEKIQYLGEDIYEIAIREPRAGDIFRVGNPVKYDLRFDPPEIEFDEDKAFKMLSRLSGIPVEGSLERMTSNDAVSCFWGMAGFFIPGLSPKQSEQPAS
jgi:hypothetical protein